jgi:ferric-dicitrate binding protein FerR (iron transport regulator)
VFLNKQTKIEYAFNKKERTHNVKLEGEAYFSIKHDEDAQYIVRAGEVLIKDIGTSFNVKAYPNSDIVEVLVEEGEVIFYTDANPGIRLKKSGRAIYDKKTKQFNIEKPEPNITAYKTKFFVFGDATLDEVAASFNAVYDSALVVPDHLKKCRITVTFRDETLQQAVSIIGETLNLSVTQQENKYILNGTRCE